MGHVDFEYCAGSPQIFDVSTVSLKTPARSGKTFSLTIKGKAKSSASVAQSFSVLRSGSIVLFEDGNQYQKSIKTGVPLNYDNGVVLPNFIQSGKYLYQISFSDSIINSSCIQFWVSIDESSQPALPSNRYY